MHSRPYFHATTWLGRLLLHSDFQHSALLTVYRWEESGRPRKSGQKNISKQ